MATKLSTMFIQVNSYKPDTSSRTTFLVVFFLILTFQGYSESDSALINRFLKTVETYQTNQPDTALKIADKAYQVALQSKDPLLLIPAYNAFANIYYYSGNQQLALDYYFKALRQLEEYARVKESPENVRLTARIYNNIGNCYFDMKMQEMALTYYKKSLALVDETNRKKPGIFTPRHKMLLLYNIGNILSERKEYDLAKKYYLEAQEINVSVNDMYVKAGLLESLAWVLIYQGQDTEPLQYFDQALAVRKSMNDLRGITGTYMSYGDFYLLKHDTKKAKEWYLKGVALGKESARWQLVQAAADHLTKIFEDQKEFRKAFEMKSLSSQLNDSIFNNQSTARLTRLSLQYEYDRQIKLQEEKQQKEIDRQKNRKIFFILISTIFLLLIILGILLLINQRKKLIHVRLKQKQLDLESKNVQLENKAIRLEKESLENELLFKNKELALNVMYLVQKNEFITDIAERTRGMISELPSHIKQGFAHLAADLQRNTDEKVWKEFEVRFQEVHQDFYRSLNEKFPTLTPNEKKLAAFLRLNMSTKDISAITFQSPESIRMARSRLRKKMGLDSDENLIAYLESI
jgi:DNA-binding CsgD family transcriptional regulator